MGVGLALGDSQAEMPSQIVADGCDPRYVARMMMVCAYGDARVRAYGRGRLFVGARLAISSGAHGRRAVRARLLRMAGSRALSLGARVRAPVCNFGEIAGLAGGSDEIGRARGEGGNEV